MTKPYAAKRLLEHGRLTFSELWMITRWTKEDVTEAMNALMSSGCVRLVNKDLQMYYVLTTN